MTYITIQTGKGAGPTRRGIGMAPMMIVVVVAALLAGGLVLFLTTAGRSSAPATLTPEAKSYVRNLGLSGVQMSAKENMMSAMLVEITGRIENKGERSLRLVEINCVFHDAMGQPVHRERVPIVRAKGGALRPGEARQFRLAFDSLPEGWNQAMPQLVIANIDFEGPA